MSDSLQPGLHSPWNSQASILEYCHRSSQPRIQPGSSTSQPDSLPTEPPGKPKNTRVCSLSLHSSGSSWPRNGSGSPAFRQIFYQLSYQEALLRNNLRQKSFRLGTLVCSKSKPDWMLSLSLCSHQAEVQFFHRLFLLTIKHVFHLLKKKKTCNIIIPTVSPLMTFFYLSGQIR